MNILFRLKPSLHQITATMNILIVNILKEEKEGIKFQEKINLYTCLELNIMAVASVPVPGLNILLLEYRYR